MANFEHSSNCYNRKPRQTETTARLRRLKASIVKKAPLSGMFNVTEVIEQRKLFSTGLKISTFLKKINQGALIAILF